jgi:hypothetical protein
VRITFLTNQPSLRPGKKCENIPAEIENNSDKEIFVQQKDFKSLNGDFKANYQNFGSTRIAPGMPQRIEVNLSHNSISTALGTRNVDFIQPYQFVDKKGSLLKAKDEPPYAKGSLEVHIVPTFWSVFLVCAIGAAVATSVDYLAIVKNHNLHSLLSEAFLVTIVVNLGLSAVV